MLIWMEGGKHAHIAALAAMRRERRRESSTEMKDKPENVVDNKPKTEK